MSHTHLTKRERACETASLGAHVFASTWAMGFEDALAEAGATLDELLQYADAWDRDAYTHRQEREDQRHLGGIARR